jgi:3-dehydrosphinganine reductase
MMGYFGIMGFAAYAPTKFAVTGLAEVLRHELKPYNIRISVIYPPDTDTPGFKTENLTKPPECKMLSEGVKLMSAEKVARIFVDGILKKRFAIFPGGSGFIWRMYRHFPKTIRWIMDMEYRKAKKTCKKELRHE